MDHSNKQKKRRVEVKHPLHDLLMKTITLYIKIMAGKNKAAMSNKIVVKKPTSAQSGPKTPKLTGASPSKYKKC